MSGTDGLRYEYTVEARAYFTVTSDHPLESGSVKYMAVCDVDWNDVEFNLEVISISKIQKTAPTSGA